MVKPWMKYTLILAGIYNILWGTWVVLFPHHIFKLTGATLPNYLEIWQCVGMIVAVYGLGYYISAFNPMRHWPIILVGFLGKVFGPIGFIGALYNKVFPLAFGVNIIFNDLIWWIPFGLILYEKFQTSKGAIGEIKTLNEAEFSKFEDRKRARLINSLSGFKSANLLGTQNKDGKTNLSIVSSVFHLGANPALIGLIIRPDTVRRDTLENMRETQIFTINHVNHEIVERAHQTSARYLPDQSEFDECSLTPQYLNNFQAPYVLESKIKLAVKLIREEKIEENGTILIIGQIIEIHYPSNCLDNDGKLNIERAGTICVSGLDNYHSTESIGRLSYAKPDKKLEWI